MPIPGPPIVAPGIPTIQVLLDDGTGTYPTDITSRVSLAAGIGVSGFGRTDEFSTASPSSLSFTLKNDDGAMAAGSLAPGQKIRLKETFGATSVTRFTGRVSELGLGWNGGVAKSSAVTVTAVDLLSDLSRRPLRSMLEEEILLRSPTAYYTLGEASGSTSAGDTSGNQAPPLTIVGTGAAMTFGTGTGPVDGMTAATFAGGKWLRGTNSGGFLGTGAFTVELFVVIPTPPATVTTHFLAVDNDGGSGTGSSGVDWYVSAVGQTEASIQWGAGTGFSDPLVSTTNICDGLLHHLVFTFDGVNTVVLYVDGTAEATNSLAQPLPTPMTILSVGGYAGLPDPDAFVGTISNVVIHDGVALTAAQVANIATGGHTSFAGETTAARLTRLASYLPGITTSTTTGMSGQTMSAQATSGESLLDAMQAVALAEGGVLYANGDGTIVLQGRGYRAGKTTPTLTVSAKDLDSSLAVTWDTQQVVNQIAATANGGAAQMVSDQTSINIYGPVSQSLDLAVDSDGAALRAAQWLVNLHSTSSPRLGSATVNLLTSSSGQSILAAQIGDRWALSGMPTQNWSNMGDLTVEGWTETLTVSADGAEWSMTVNLLPFALFAALILDDPVYGALDSYPIMN